MATTTLRNFSEYNINMLICLLLKVKENVNNLFIFFHRRLLLTKLQGREQWGPDVKGDKNNSYVLVEAYA